MDSNQANEMHIDTTEKKHWECFKVKHSLVHTMKTIACLASSKQIPSTIGYKQITARNEYNPKIVRLNAVNCRHLQSYMHTFYERVLRAVLHSSAYGMASCLSSPAQVAHNFKYRMRIRMQLDAMKEKATQIKTNRKSHNVTLHTVNRWNKSKHLLQQ